MMEITEKEACASFAAKYHKVAAKVTLMVRAEAAYVNPVGKTYVVPACQFALIDGKYIALKSTKHNLGYNGRRREAHFDKVMVMLHKMTTWEKYYLVAKAVKEGK